MKQGKKNSLAEENDLIRIAADTKPAMVAGAIAKRVRQFGHAYIRAIGAAAVNQTVKALAVAQSYLNEDGIAIAYTNHFVELTMDENEHTAMNFHVFVHQPITPDTN
jgi:stage V sporulation protein S